MDIKDVLDERIICSSLETKDKEDPLTEEEIAQADVVILAIDVAISGKERFKGKKTVEVPTEMVVHSPNALIAKIEEIVKG